MVGPVAQLTFRQLVVFCLFAYLEQGTRSPIGTDHFGSGDGDVAVHPDGIALAAKFLVFLQRKVNVTGRRFALSDSRSSAEHLPIIGRKGFGHGTQSLVGIDDAHVGGRNKITFTPLPFFQFRNDKRFLILGIQAHLYKQ